MPEFEHTKLFQSERRLAAILFADIVGYTALMQHDEQHASNILRHFQNQLKEKVTAHNGRIVNSYGDGCLCTFQIPLDAVRCALELQVSFKEMPKVPVRIGIHSGTVTMEEDKIFGDSVNIASRIESMGMAGAILLSKQVRNEVKNNPDLELLSLGSFTFKNVEEPMELFALVNEGLIIPKAQDLPGRLTKKHLKKNSLFLIGLLTAIIILIALWLGFRKQQTIIPDDKSIAVLPFQDLSPNQDQEYFCDGVAEEILVALSKLEGLKVAGQLSSFSFKGKKDITLIEIADQLKVSTILSGSIRKNGNQIKVTANLINAKDGFQLWSEVYDEELKDIFQIQEKIAKNIVRKFKLEQSLQGDQQLLVKQTSSLEAYELFLKGKFYLNKSIDGVEKAEEAFEKALELDPEYTLAYLGLAEVNWLKTIYGLSNREEAFEAMRAYAVKANTLLDPENPAAYNYLARYYSLFKQDWQMSLDYLNKGLDLDSSNLEAYQVMLILIDPNPANTQKLIEINRELVSKDPLSIGALLNLNRAYLWAKQYDHVIENAQKVFELDPQQRSNMRHISEAYMFSGQPEKALPFTEQMVQKYGYAYHDYITNLVLLDREEEAKKLFLENAGTLDAYSTAVCYFILGDWDQGFQHLEQAWQDKDPKLYFSKSDPHFDPIRDDPRFIEFEKKLNYPKVVKN